MHAPNGGRERERNKSCGSTVVRRGGMGRWVEGLALKMGGGVGQEVCLYAIRLIMFLSHGIIIFNTMAIRGLLYYMRFW